MPELKPVFENDFQSFIIHNLHRIANAQEGMLAIMAEARSERMKLAAQMKERLKADFIGGANERPDQSKK